MTTRVELHADSRDCAPVVVSVVVPTRNRAAQLRDVLESLAAQTYPLDRFEVIVVDNASSDGTGEVVRQAAEAGLPVRYLVKANDGPAASRNRGAELAIGQIIAYTDSDCLPSPQWIEEGVRAFAPGVGVVCGPIHPTEITQEHPFFLHQINPVTREDGLYPTANVFYRRSLLLELGGFDETSRTYAWGQPIGGDDTEMAWRVKRNGSRSVFAERAIVRHQSSPVSPREYLLNSVQAQVIPRMVVVAPELREMCFYRRYFLKKQNVLFYLALLGTAAFRRSAWSLIFAAPWLRSIAPVLRLDAWPPRRWGRCALRFAIQIESSLLLVAALLYGSVKHRRLVL